MLFQVCALFKDGETLHITIMYFIVSKGVSGNLMKLSSMRRRGKLELQELKRNAEIQRLETERKLAQYEQIEEELRGAREMIQRTDQLAMCAQEMIDQGFLKPQEDGSITFIEDPTQRAQLAELNSSKKKEAEQIQPPEKI